MSRLAGTRRTPLGDSRRADCSGELIVVAEMAEDLREVGLHRGRPSGARVRVVVERHRATERGPGGREVAGAARIVPKRPFDSASRSRARTLLGSAARVCSRNPAAQ